MIDQFNLFSNGRQFYNFTPYFTQNNTFEIGIGEKTSLTRTFSRNLKIYKTNNISGHAIFRCVCISSTYPGQLVGWFVSGSHFQISTVSADHGTWYIFWKLWPTAFRLLFPKLIFLKYIFWKCILCKNIFAMCTRLTHLLSFASSFLLPLRTLFLFNHLKTSINFQKTIHTSFSWHFSEYSQEQLPDMCEKYISSERRESQGRKVYLFYKVFFWPHRHSRRDWDWFKSWDFTIGDLRL